MNRKLLVGTIGAAALALSAPALAADSQPAILADLIAGDAGQVRVLDAAEAAECTGSAFVMVFATKATPTTWKPHHPVHWDSYLTHPGIRNKVRGPHATSSRWSFF